MNPFLSVVFCLAVLITIVLGLDAANTKTLKQEINHNNYNERP